ncbi:hypothetical protein AURDEDRAFT_171905 [Auricularia subglabra TFB-10046 SS5]|uniref:Uncharacterized protein n=1 Tax=Auricularia subglabra (strain TFB-10046 / SS5) TaxID=717982 RepID=J0WX75_AURST|nr:hypothetical protein AURDEDRAFT_171905 [Auricularia subglabra TFB-10046 SS5]
MFDPIREYQQRLTSGRSNSLQIDTAPSSFRQQWERECEHDAHPTSSPILGALFHYNAGLGISDTRSCHPISPRPALFYYCSGPICAPTLHLVYVIQAESSLRLVSNHVVSRDSSLRLARWSNSSVWPSVFGRVVTAKIGPGGV